VAGSSQLLEVSGYTGLFFTIPYEIVHMSTFKEELNTGFAKVFKDSGIKIVTYLKYFIHGT